MIAALAFSGVQTWRVGNLKKENHQYELKLETSNASIALLESSIEKTKQSIEDAAKLAEDKKRASKEALSKAKQVSRDLQDQIESIRSQKTTSNGLCPTPPSILNVEGL